MERNPFPSEVKARNAAARQESGTSSVGADAGLGQDLAGRDAATRLGGDDLAAVKTRRDVLLTALGAYFF